MTNRPRKVDPVLLAFARDMRRDPAIPEKKLWLCVRDRRLDGLKFRRQHAIGPYIADFYCAACKLIIELDGDSHADKQSYDEDRTKYLNGIGLHVIRFSNDDIHKHLDDVLRCIMRECEQRLRE